MARPDAKAKGGMGEPLVVASLWALLTVAYAAHVLSRWAASGRAPGLSTLTAAGAVTAVWLYFPIHYRARLRLDRARAFRWTRALLLLVLATVVVTEWVTVYHDLVRRGALRPIPAVSAFAFTFVFRHLLLDLLTARPPRGPGG